jgi:hypothetical protein
MADKKISALTASTTPLAGTEVLPIVQSGATVKVAVSDLTAGRTVSGLNFISGSDTTNFNVVAGTTTTAPGISAYGKSTGAAPGWVVYTSGTADFVGTHAWYKNDFAGTATYLGGWYSNGDYKLNNGNVVIGTSGKGIDFSATAGTGTSELLADYEEGTWTATLSGSITNPLTPQTTTGTYVKIGRSVTVQAYFNGADTTGGVGDLSITGLPYTVGSVRGTAVIGMSGFGTAPAFGAAIGTVIYAANMVNTTAISINAGAGKYLYLLSTYQV